MTHLFSANLNDYVWFKPIDGKAEDFLRKEALREAEPYRGSVCYADLVSDFTRTLNRDEDGWCRWLIYDFMRTFGPNMFMGSSLVIENEIRLEAMGEGATVEEALKGLEGRS